MDSIILRDYRSGDLDGLEHLFYDTVHTVNAADYSPEQLNAWAPGTVDRARWDRTLREHFTRIAEHAGQIVGFGDLAAEGYLDRLYVHKDRQSQGVASALCDALEDACPAAVFTTHASLTARPFFELRGYRVLRRQPVIRHGVPLDNYVMEKRK